MNVSLGDTAENDGYIILASGNKKPIKPLKYACIGNIARSRGYI